MLVDMERKLKSEIKELEWLHKEKRERIYFLITWSILCVASLTVLIWSIVLGKSASIVLSVISFMIAALYTVLHSIELKSVNKEMKKTSASIRALLSQIQETMFKMAMEQLVKSIREKARQRREELEKAEKEKKKTATKKTTKKTSKKKEIKK